VDVAQGYLLGRPMPESLLDLCIGSRTGAPALGTGTATP
jgi:EAL domain-containing protein (putative c-di-GMP-specific phosphodiesterase class I)